MPDMVTADGVVDEDVILFTPEQEGIIFCKYLQKAFAARVLWIWFTPPIPTVLSL